MIQITISVRTLVFVLLLGVALFAGSDVVRGAPSAADLNQDGNIIFSGPGVDGARDIRTTNNDGGLRFYNGNGALSNPPDGAAIQFFGNDRGTFNGQAFIDSGAHNSAAIIFRTAGTGQGITERMRINAAGGITMGTGATANRPGERASANGSISATGDAQSSVLVMRGLIPNGPDGGTVNMSLDGTDSGEFVAVPLNHSLAVNIDIVLRGSTNGISEMYICQVVVKNVSGTVNVNGGTTAESCTSVPGGGNTDIGPFVIASSNSFRVVLSRENATTQDVRGVATVRLTEVSS